MCAAGMARWYGRMLQTQQERWADVWMGERAAETGGQTDGQAS